MQTERKDKALLQTWFGNAVAGFLLPHYLSWLHRGRAVINPNQRGRHDTETLILFSLRTALSPAVRGQDPPTDAVSNELAQSFLSTCYFLSYRINPASDKSYQGYLAFLSPVHRM